MSKKQKPKGTPAPKSTTSDKEFDNLLTNALKVPKPKK